MSDQADAYLLRGGIILGHGTSEHDALDTKLLKDHDLLIVGNSIAEIGRNLEPPAGKKVDIIDCAEKIVAPGFVSTHNHLWQTQLKGRHGDDTQAQFHVKGNLQATRYTPYDVYLGVLAACLECTDAGITTVVDHAHMAVSEAHSLAALAAIRDSHIRAVFCYTVQPNEAKDGFPAWAKDQFRQIRSLELPSRITIGFAADALTSWSQWKLSSFFRDHLQNVALFTAHWGEHPAFPQNEEHSDFLKHIANLAKQEPDNVPQILIAHCCQPAIGSSTSEWSKWTRHASPKLTKLNHASVPFAEPSLGLGTPPIMGALDIRSARTSLGIGCHSINAAEMFTQMRTALALGRLVPFSNASVSGRNRVPEETPVKIRDVFHLATIKGADVLGRKKDFGSIRVGAKADLVIYDCSSIQMSLVAEEDPYTAIVNYASAADIEYVFIDGHLRKRKKTLSVVDAIAAGPINDSVFADERTWLDYLGKKDISLIKSKGLVKACAWPDIRKALRESRNEINKRIREKREA